MTTVIKSHKDLLVWQRAMELCQDIYILTKNLPKEERYGLVSQMRRSSVAIPSNIAEGHARGHRNEYIQFLYIAHGSGSELETQLLLCKNLNFIGEQEYRDINQKAVDVIKLLSRLITALKPNTENLKPTL